MGGNDPVIRGRLAVSISAGGAACGGARGTPGLLAAVGGQEGGLWDRTQ